MSLGRLHRMEREKKKLPIKYFILFGILPFQHSKAIFKFIFPLIKACISIERNDVYFSFEKEENLQRFCPQGLK